MTTDSTVLAKTTFRFLLHVHTRGIGGEGRRGVLITPDIRIYKYENDMVEVITNVGLGETCGYTFHAKHGVGIEQTLLATALEMSPRDDLWTGFAMIYRKEFVVGMVKLVERIMDVTPNRFHVDNVLSPIES